MEGALVFASIILGVGVTDELMSLHRMLRARRRVRWDWAVPAVALLVLLTIVQIWWSTQNLTQQHQGPMTIGAYLPLVVELILLFLLAAAVLPDEVPAEGLDLKNYYDENGSYIWALYSAALGWVTAVRFMRAARQGDSLAVLVETSIVDLLVLGLMVSLIFVRRRWWHAIVLLILFTGPLGWLSKSIGSAP